MNKGYLCPASFLPRVDGASQAPGIDPASSLIFGLRCKIWSADRSAEV